MLLISLEKDINLLPRKEIVDVKIHLTSCRFSVELKSHQASPASVPLTALQDSARQPMR